MKRIILLAGAFVLAVGIQLTNAQEKLNEGKLTFEISYPDAEEMNDQMLAMMPSEMTMYFKEGKSRGETKMGFGTTIMLSDSKTKDAVVCMDMMGNKTAMKLSQEDAEKEKADRGDYEVKITDDTKTIAGYKCHKAIISFKKDESTTEVWFTKDIAAANSPRNSWKGIDGFLLEFSAEQKGMHGNIKMKMVCTKVEKMAVSDDMFKIPDGYQVKTMDEMMQQYKQGGKAKTGGKDDPADKK